jgi:hypothetical protein
MWRKKCCHSSPSSFHFSCIKPCVSELEGLKEQVIRVAIAPLLARFERLDDRVKCGMKVFGRVLIRRAVATANVAAGFAQSQVHPGVARLQAIFTPLRAGRDRPYLIEVETLSSHCPSLPKRYCEVRRMAKPTGDQSG